MPPILADLTAAARIKGKMTFFFRKTPHENEKFFPREKYPTRPLLVMTYKIDFFQF